MSSLKILEKAEDMFEDGEEQEMLNRCSTLKIRLAFRLSNNAIKLMEEGRAEITR